jgi:hypothetical protein
LQEAAVLEGTVKWEKCHYIVGNSKFYETLLPTEEFLAALFAASGFNAIGIRALRKRTSKKELYEYVVEGTL